MAFFRRRDVGQAFRNNRELAQFVLTDVTPTGRTLGTGSFGSVEEVTYQQTICAGKRIHEILLNVENEGVPEMVSKYLRECQLMSNLRHPNVTQFLGLCFLPGTQLPLLVMERLETSLDDLLENVPNVPLTLKRSILENVASGLLYLHKRNPPVIHRDLTSKNVLLTSSIVAKITDMGNSRIADMRPGQMVRTLSALPGTLVYMPPEALDNRHRYGASLDIFSFGHLALFTITQRFPGDLLPITFYDAGNLQARNELQRREQYIEIMEAIVGHHHPALVELVKECLHNAPEQRPTTNDLLARLQRMREEVEGQYGAIQGKVDLSKMRLARELRQKDRRLEELTQLQERHEAELADKDAELAGKVMELEEKTREVEANNGLMEQEIARRDTEIASKAQEIAQQRSRVQQLQKDVEDLQANFLLRETRLREELQSQAAEISRLIREKSQGEGSKITLKLPLQLKWRRGPDMPFPYASYYVQSVLVKGTVYVGGGGGAGGDNDYIVMAYNISAGKWATLPPYQICLFAMAAVDNHLVLVGGYGVSSKVLGVWSTDSKEWTHPYPDMTTPRSMCSAVSYKHWLVVAGGQGALSSVEVMNTNTKQWYAGPRTPIAWDDMKTAVVGDMCYYMGGTHTGNVYSVSLPALVSQLNSDSCAKDTETWTKIPQLQVTNAAPLSISGSLVAVGGVDKDRKTVSTLHLYQPDTRQWVKVADMPTARRGCTCLMITDKDIFVTGGQFSEQVDIAQIC